MASGERSGWTAAGWVLTEPLAVATPFRVLPPGAGLPAHGCGDGFPLTRAFLEVADKKKEVFDGYLAAICSDQLEANPEEYQLDYITVVTSLEGVPTATLGRAGARRPSPRSAPVSVLFTPSTAPSTRSSPRHFALFTMS